MPCDTAKAHDAMKAYYETLTKEAAGTVFGRDTKRMETAEETAKIGQILCGDGSGVQPGVMSCACGVKACRRATRLIFEILNYQDKYKKWPASLERLADRGVEIGEDGPVFGQAVRVSDRGRETAAVQRGKEWHGRRRNEARREMGRRR